MLRVNNIIKSFNTVKAVNDVTFKINGGEFYFLLGPNGAGKTTTINIISTLLKPDRGSVYINDLNIHRNSRDAKMIMGIIPQEIALYDDLSAYDNLLFFGSLYGIRRHALRKKANDLLEWMELSDRKGDLLKIYSGGMKRRVNIAAALMHNPALLVMDEPTVGIDPQSRNKIYDMLRELHKNGMTILYTTHYMHEAEMHSDVIAIIDNGKIIAEGSLSELKSKSNTEEVIVIKFEGSISSDTLEDFRNKYTLQNNELKIFSNKVHLELPYAVKYFSEKNIAMLSIEIISINLETIFLELTGRQLRDE